MSDKEESEWSELEEVSEESEEESESETEYEPPKINIIMSSRISKQIKISQKGKEIRIKFSN